MIVSSWNCRGACGKTFPRLLKQIVQKYSIRVMALMETRVSGARADKITTRLGFSNWFRVEATGFAGGIWVLWNNWDVDIQYIGSNTQVIHCKLTEKTSCDESYVSFVYGEPNAQMRVALWSYLRSLAHNVRGKWLVVGDFNAFLRNTDKEGGSAANYQSMKQFRECVHDCGLLELPVEGDKFTWGNKRVKERIDWALCNIEWETKMGDCKVYHGLRFKSDHRVIIVKVGDSRRDTNRNPQFKYQAGWNLDEGFRKIVTEAWKDSDWVNGCAKFRKSAAAWNQNIVGSYAKKRKELLRRLEGVDRALRLRPHRGLLKLQDRLWGDYMKVINQEELLWYQKTRSKWLQFGDRNTSFFHASAKVTQRRLKVSSLQNEAGDLIEDPELLKQEANRYFQQLFKKDEGVINPDAWPSSYKVLDEATLTAIQRSVRLGD